MDATLKDSAWKNILIESIVSKTAKTGVMGLGYVGLPLAVEMAQSGFDVTGIEIDPVKVETIQSGRSYIGGVPSSLVSKLVTSGKFRVTTSFDDLSQLDTINICVPASLRKARDPDLSCIKNMIHEMIPHIHHGQLIILESATYPGTTEEILLPMIQSTGLEVGKDIFLAYSPERDDPGNYRFKTKDIPKVVGGVTPACAEVASRFYAQFIHKVVSVSSLKAAEMVKLLENTFRSVNIAMINEMALLCHKMGIDVWEVIEAVKTKPFGFMSFTPGPGIGGHGIPMDPAYLSWKAKISGFDPRFIDLAGQINGSMPEFVVSRMVGLLNDRQKCLSGSKILIVGVSYKKDVEALQGSPAFDVARLLIERGADLMFYDPFVQQVTIGGRYFQRVGLEIEILQNCDMVVILTDHSGIDYARIVKHARLIFDTRNAARRFKFPHVVRL
ncbi:MAG: nucleotide sugar dehydrogenase [Nitrospiria bacterium]